MNKVLNKINLVITILMVIGLILLIIGCYINNDYLIYGSLGGIGFVYMLIALPLRMLFSEVKEDE